MENNLFLMLGEKRKKDEMIILKAANENLAAFGLSLTNEETTALIASRDASLEKYQRVEFGRGILDKIILEFCDSQYLEQDNCAETLQKLVDIFYQFKNAAMDQITDEELLTFMREQFETVCFGDVEYLESTCLERFARAIRSGYDGHLKTQGSGEYSNLSEETRWDQEVYQSVLKELFW